MLSSSPPVERYLEGKLEATERKIEVAKSMALGEASRNCPEGGSSPTDVIDKRGSRLGSK